MMHKKIWRTHASLFWHLHVRRSIPCNRWQTQFPEGEQPSEMCSWSCSWKMKSSMPKSRRPRVQSRRPWSWPTYAYAFTSTRINTCTHVLMTRMIGAETKCCIKANTHTHTHIYTHATNKQPSRHMHSRFVEERKQRQNVRSHGDARFRVVLTLRVAFSLSVPEVVVVGA
jgi:hypothetical protein